MKNLNFYNETLKCKSSDDVFNCLLNNLKPSILLWSYFVNWEKVFKNEKAIEISLNTLNYLIGKKDFDNEFKSLLKQHPEIVKAIPSLIVRDGGNNLKFKILVDYKQKRFVYDDYDFSKVNLNEADIDRYLTFVKETGLKNLITSNKIKNLVDYIIGVEAGIDSNGRKNRSGHSMENIVEFFIQDLCKKQKFRYIKQADANKIKREFNYTVPVDKSSRKYDFVLDNGKELYIFETNFYSGGGSKLKSTAGEYRNLFDVLKGQFKFIWITDGFGWKTTTRPLRETFDHNDYLFNLFMLENEVLNFLIP
ncbi:MAG TPA: restriction endonuclease [Dehalococcoidia bacterium]|nr:restriction endonuclease [Dehalococcoidia bacterium]